MESLIGTIIREYIAIVEHLRDSVKLEIINYQLVIDKTKFLKMLNKNLYMKETEKLRIYKQLNFIDSTENKLTKVIYDKEQKKAIRKIVINYKTYEILKEFYSTEN